jgi:citrate lyase synthetase
MILTNFFAISALSCSTPTRFRQYLLITYIDNGCRFVGNEQGCRASSDKNQFTKEWLQKADRLDEQIEIVL